MEGWKFIARELLMEVGSRDCGSLSLLYVLAARYPQLLLFLLLLHRRCCSTTLSLLHGDILTGKRHSF